MDIKYRVVFYTDQAGRSTIEDYIMELNSRSDKESRIKDWRERYGNDNAS